MKINVPNLIGAGDFTTDVPETDHPEYDPAAIYAAADRVQITATHRVYESIAGGNQGNPPASSTAHWIEVGRTNPHKPFDGNKDDQAERQGSMRYTFPLAVLSDSLTLINVEATSVRVVVRDQAGVVVYDQTRQIIDTSQITGWFEYFTWDPVYQPDVLFLDLPGYGAHTLEVTIDAGAGVARVGQILVGRTRTIGRVTGAEVTFRSFSTREFDTYGRPSIVPRATRRRISYQIIYRADENDRAQRTIAALDVTPAYYFAGDGIGAKGVGLFGTFPNLRSPVAASGWVYATLEVEGL